MLSLNFNVIFYYRFFRTLRIIVEYFEVTLFVFDNTVQILFLEASESSNSQLKSFWGYVEAAHKRSPVFYNPLYSPKLLTTKVRVFLAGYLNAQIGWGSQNMTSLLAA